MVNSSQPQVAFYLRMLSGGGAERVIVTLMNKFIEQGINVDLVLNIKEGAYLSQVPDAVRVIDLGTPKLPNGLPKLIKYLRQKRPQALFAALHYNTEIAIAAKLLAGVPTRVIVSERNTLSVRSKYQKDRERWAPLLAKFSYRLADGITAVSQGVANDLAQITGISPEKIKVIYNPVDQEKLLIKAQETVDHPWFQPDQPPVIIGIGRLHQQKDFPTLIQAFKMVNQQHPCRLVILGQGPEKKSLNRLVHELGLEENIAFLGFVKNPYAYLKRASVFVLSSIWEGMPNVLLEAVFLGVPAVATDCAGGGAAEILDQGRFGSLVPIGDAQAMADEIGKILSGTVKSYDPQWLEQFSIDKISQKYIDVLGIKS